MKIAIDVSSVTNGKAGIGYYAFNLALNLPKSNENNEYLLFTNNKENLKDLKILENTRIIEISSSRVNLMWILKTSIALWKNKVDVLISPSNFTFGLFFPRTIQFVHDLGPVFFPQYFPKGSASKYTKQLKLTLKRSQYIATIANTISEELINFSPESKDKIFYAGMGINESVIKNVHESIVAQVKSKFKIGNNILLSVGTLQPRKNYENTIKAFSVFAQNYPDYEYVIAGGKGWLYDDIFRLVKDLGLENKVKILGYVSEEELSALYRLAKGFLSISFYEGFGMPSIEAFVNKVPVLTADIPVFREVMGKNALYANPSEPKSIASKMEILLSQPPKYNPNLLKQYSWLDVASRINDKIDTMKK
jgi:glycosyltransferase involved in cell wall biosynthesis